MDGSLNDELFSWEQVYSAQVDFPFAVRPRMEATTVLSYRRKITLENWCNHQFGEDQVKVTGTTFAFAEQADMTMFVIMWSGIKVVPAAIADIPHKR